MTSTENRAAEWYTERIDYLAEFMLPERRAILESTLSKRTRYITLLAENVYHSQNAAALMRHCEAFGLQDMHIVQSECQFRPNVCIARGTDRWIDKHLYPTSADALAELKSKGYRIVATTPHRQSVTPETFDVEASPFVLVFGTEHEGISDEVAAAADDFLQIPMCGMVESLNVSASAAILLYMLSQRVRCDVPQWQMTSDEQQSKLYEWMRRSVKDSDNILKRQFTDF